MSLRYQHLHAKKRSSPSPTKSSISWRWSVQWRKPKSTQIKIASLFKADDSGQMLRMQCFVDTMPLCGIKAIPYCALRLGFLLPLNNTIPGKAANGVAPAAAE